MIFDRAAEWDENRRLTPTTMWRAVRVQATEQQLQHLARACDQVCDCGISYRHWINYLHEAAWIFPESCKAYQLAPHFIRDIFGNPYREVRFEPTWRSGTVIDLAQAIYQEQAFERLPILADALEEAGCTDQHVLEHCRGVPTAGCHKDFCLGTDGRWPQCPNCWSVWDANLGSRVLRGPHTQGCHVLLFCKGE